ncbi:MAG: methyltransferase domain-containing protein [Candidatus Diapherotrites archaeon]|nr:methyltransferase domain-containing protein [Candidatus Diapherotrites archaeon]
MVKTGIELLRKGSLPQLELLGIASRLGRKFRRRDSYFYTVEGDPWRFYHMALARAVGRYWFSFRKDSEIPERVKELRRYVMKFPSFGVFGKKRKELGWWLEGRVNLRDPAQRIYVYGGKRYHVLSDVKFIKGKDFAVRDARNRPFFHPSAMNARDARFLVNVAGVMPGDRVLDPFCGTGGILVEAGLLGANVMGVDIDPRMAEGCRRNLLHYGVRGTVVVDDARRVDVEADVVVTDPPYGRSSKTPDRDIKKLYLDVFERIHSIVRERFVVVLPFEGEGLLERAGFEVMGRGRWFVHSSLTRRVYLCSP